VYLPPETLLAAEATSANRLHDDGINLDYNTINTQDVSHIALTGYYTRKTPERFLLRFASPSSYSFFVLLNQSIYLRPEPARVLPVPTIPPIHKVTGNNSLVDY